MSDKTVSNMEEKPKKPKKNMKKFKYGSMSLAVIVLVIVLVIIVNLMCSMLAKRSPLKIDLTPDKRYELSDESIEAVKNLDRDVEITVTFQKSDFDSMGAYYQQMYLAYYGINVETPYEMIPSILEKYELYSKQGKGNIKVQYVDMNKDPDIIARYRKFYNNDIPEGSIVVFSGDDKNGRVKVISEQEVLSMIKPANTSTQTAVTMSFVGESTLTSAILNVTDSNPIRTAFVTAINGASVAGSDTATVSGIMEFLSKNGYDCTEVDIATDDISPVDYDMIVVPMPTVDFTADIIDKLGDFLYNGGNYERDMLYIPNMTVNDLPNISEFLADWSIEVDKNFVMDDKNWVYISDLRNLNIMAEVNDADSVGTLPNDTLPIVAPASKKLSILTKNNDSVATSVLRSMDTSYDTEDQTTGARDIAVISRKETSVGVDTYTSHLLVLGSSVMTDSAILEQTNTFNNANVLIGMINTMTGKEANAVIPEKALQQAKIAPDASQLNIIKILVIYVIPAIVAVCGVIVFVRRRNR
ncbi:MAG: GldG family protein [Ruminococcus sp.]|nr:GldG family protein [Ruminococcus sp.]